MLELSTNTNCAATLAIFFTWWYIVPPFCRYKDVLKQLKAELKEHEQLRVLKTRMNRLRVS